MVIITGKSAWEYWRTPPLIRDSVLDQEEVLMRIPTNSKLAIALCEGVSRSRAPKLASRLRGRLLTDLKGIHLPIHAASDESGYVCKSSLLHVRKMSVQRLKERAYPLGNDIYVSSPEQAITQMVSESTRIKTLQLIYEACGSYAVFAPNLQSQLAIQAIEHELSPLGWEALDTLGAPHYADADGARSHLVTEQDEHLLWKPCLDRNKKLTTLWRRPAISSAQSFKEFSLSARYLHGLRRIRELTPYIIDGSASPIETNMVLICCLPPHMGGEEWEHPILNMRIDLSPAAQKLSYTTYCIGDQVWPNIKLIIEENGEAYHSDRDGFALASGRRAALEAMGYIVQEINYRQMSDPEQLDQILLTIAEKAGFGSQPRTPAFIKSRYELCHDLFLPE